MRRDGSRTSLSLVAASVGAAPAPGVALVLVALLMLVAAQMLGACSRQPPTREHGSASASAAAPRASELGARPAAANAAPSARVLGLPETLAMELPQPEPEPAAPDGGEGEPSWTLPPDTHLVLGSQVVQSTREPRRQGTLVNVWATWCGSCEAEMPMLAELGRRYAAQGIEVLFVSVDEPGAAEQVQAALKARKIPGPAYIARPRLGPFKRALSPLWKGSLPATFLYDNGGRLRFFWGAQAYEGEVTAILDGFLRGEKIDGMANFSITRGESGP